MQAVEACHGSSVVQLESSSTCLTCYYHILHCTGACLPGMSEYPQVSRRPPCGGGGDGYIDCGEAKFKMVKDIQIEPFR